MKTNNTIYTIPTKVGNIETVHIETVVTRGLYRFSILGINQREASDTRDRVYSALRSTDVFNLKSDNRKITVNIIPSYKLEYSRVYDLAVALSCLQAVGRFDIDEKVLVIGELSICGNILCSKQLLQTIFIAIRDNIKIIICGEEDIDCIQADIVDIIRKNNINLCVAKNIRELLQRISKKEWCVFASKTERGLIPDRDYTVNMKRLELNILSNEIVMLMYIALCGGHDIVFETPNSVFIGDFISDIYNHTIPLSVDQLLHIAHLTKYSDTRILSEYQYPYIGHVNSQTTRQELSVGQDLGILHKSVFGVVLIEDLIQLPHMIWNTILKSKRGQIVGICKPCPCGIESKIFTTIQQKCSCIQRSIIRHQNYLHTVYKGFFTIWVKTNVQIPKLTREDILSLYHRVRMVHKLQYTRHTSKHASAYSTHLNCCRDTSDILHELDQEAKSLFESIQDIYNQNSLDNILRLSQTLQDIESISISIKQKDQAGIEKNIAVTKQTMLLALSYIPKKDF